MIKIKKENLINVKENDIKYDKQAASVELKTFGQSNKIHACKIRLNGGQAKISKNESYIPLLPLPLEFGSALVPGPPCPIWRPV